MLKTAPGALVIYRGKAAVIRQINADKIAVAVAGGEDKLVRLKDIEVIHPGPVASAAVAAAPDPDWTEALELLGEETLDWNDFIEVVWGQFTPETALAGWLALRTGLYWEGAVDAGVKGRAAAAIAADLAALAEKLGRREARAALLERIRAAALLPEDRSSLVEVELVARGERDSSGLLRDLGIEATPEQAHRLLLRLAIWDDMVNPWPDRAGVDRKTPDFVLGELPDEARRDLSGHPAFAIDNAGSDDPDDAIGWSEDGCLLVHVADAAALIPLDSAADLEARVRGTTLYLPETVIPMLPDAALTTLGLGLNAKSPALTLKIRIAPDGVVALEEFFPSTVTVTRHTYESAAEILDSDAYFAPILAALERFDAHRAASGGSELIFPEFDVKVRDGAVIFQEVKPSRSRRMVESAMLAAGRAVAGWALEHGVAMPFVMQSYTDDAPALAGTPESWVESFRRRQYFRPSQVSSSAGPHAGLGLDAYLRVTSPLRRYTDLLTHRQLRSWLAGQPLLDSEAIDRLLTYSENGAQIRRQAERRSEEFWRMVWFKQNPQWRGEAVLLGTVRDKAVYLLPELGYEYRTRYGADGVPGTVYPVRPGQIDPAGEYCQLLFS